MEKYIYTVSQIKTVEDEGRVISIVKSCIDTIDVEVSMKTSSIRITVDEKSISKDELERKLSYALTCGGYELILPEGVSTFIPTVIKEKKAKHISLGTAIVLAVVVGLFCVMITFGICARTMTGSMDDKDPPYISDLAKLDEFFRQYSYDGIVDEKALSEHLLDAYIDFTGDIYAEYYTDEELEALDRDMAGQFVGIGVTISQGKTTIDGAEVTVINIVSIYDNSPAQSAGLLAGDMITHIGTGNNAKSVESLGYATAVNMLAGEEGSFAEFTVQRISEAGNAESLDFKIERKAITKNSVTACVCDTDAQVGIIGITNFDYTTPTQFCNAVDTLRDSGCKYFVIDLRNNPGGYAETVVAVLTYFLDEGDLIMTVEDKSGNVSSKYTAVARSNDYFSVKKEDIGKYKGLEFSVLVNENTASAAELFTATVRDYGLGNIVGTTTYGKGCLQKTYRLKSFGMSGALKLTTHMYFSKSHTSYHGTGITPDIEVAWDDEAGTFAQGAIPHEKDNQLQTAIGKTK